MIDFAPLETARFNLNCYRFQSDNFFDIKDLANVINDKAVDLLILRANSNTIEQLHQLHTIPKYKVLFADALLYYQIKLISDSVLKLKNIDLNFVVIDQSNVQILNTLVPVIFNSYRNHYYANPLLDKDKITEGYEEWAQSYINAIHENRISWLAYKNNTPVGFATCSMNIFDNSCEGILYGVHPEFAGGGIYADIIRFTKHYFANQKFNTMWVSTQLQNMAVQKVWQREGFEINKAYYTFHIIKESLFKKV